MKISVSSRPAEELMPLHELYRQEANCQLVKYSFWSRGFLDTYLIEIDGKVAGHGAVANRYDDDKILEFHTLPEHRRHALRMFHALIDRSKATHILAQSNVPLMLRMLHEFATELTAETVLFADAWATQLPSPQGTAFRQRKESAELPLFPHHVEPEGDWLLETNGAIVATGGFLTHYNPPYADLYMEVIESHRLQGFGSYLIQELKKACYAAGKLPAARCDIRDRASRCCLEKAGMLTCGHLVTGRLR